MQNSAGISTQQVAGAHEVNPSPDGSSWPHTYPWIKLKLDNGLYSSTFDKRLDSIWMFCPEENNDDAKEMSKKMPTELMAKCFEKLHGKNLEEDLKLARLYHDGMGGKGFVSNFKQKDGYDGYVNLIGLDGVYVEDYKIQVKDGDFNLGYRNEKKGKWYDFTYQFMFHFK